MTDWRPYTNGNGRANGSSAYLNRFDFQDGASSREQSDERPHRGGGYGNLGSYASSNSSRFQGSGRLERAYGTDRSGHGHSSSNSRSRSRTGYGGPASDQVEDVVRYIEQQWNFMASEECIPIKIALQLNDPSSLGLMDQYEQFQETHKQLQNALKGIVNEHHQGFNSSIGTFHKIQAAIHSSQHRVRTLKAGLMGAKGSLASAKPELRAFAQSSQNYDAMLTTLSTIETLQLIPDRLEAQISEKRFLGAVDTLQEALKMIRKPEMEEIGALGDLKVYLSNQEHSLTDILIEELHAHLYLKSPYCEERWKSRTATDVASAALIESDHNIAIFLETFDGANPMQEDPTRNPESDTFYYIHLLLEALHKMARLKDAIDAIEERLPIELFRVVERSHTEVEQRHPQILRSANIRNQSLADDGLNEENGVVLNDLLTTLFAKFEAIAEGHRVVFDVTGALVKRDSLEDGQNLNRGFRELWKLLQSEIRSLLHDHLTSDGDLSNRSRNNNNAIANIFKPHARDRNRKLFTMSETDDKSSDLAIEREDLEYILKASVPGLVSSNTLSGAQKASTDSTTSQDRSATGHKLLVTPTVFNMGILLSPSLEFLNRLKDVVPANSGVVASTLPSFLDDFLINVFYPQLDESLSELVNRCFMDLDAFQVLPSWAEHSAKPLFKGTVRFFETIENVCKMLDTLPHDQSFSQLVISQLRSYYDRCYTWSKSLLQRTQAGQPKMRLAADLATSGDVSKIVIDILMSGADDAGKAALAMKESDTLIGVTKQTPVDELDLISDIKSLGLLCALHTSMKWLAARCQTLRYVSPLAVDVNNGPQTARRWTTPAAASTPSTPYLPLDSNTALEFDGVVASFVELSVLILRTLHLDIRLHMLQSIESALRTTYALEQPYNDPDPAILKLSSDLTAYDAQLTTYVLPNQYTFLTSNLHVLASQSLITLSSSVPAMDEFGLARMLLNVTVLQQSLKNIEPGGQLSAAERFYRLGLQGCDNIVAQGKKEGFKAEDLKSLVRLVWIKERDGQGGSVEDYQNRLGLFK
ncbi:hypothetical protein AMS68_003960 [Peltaster fructicola]|uniref:Exocyst complex component Sec8 n=1 Tax=Peltaster fructicola TaxID=286661 RepID=A0A6H0XUN3_9PEZI|nr:hypothetical protein AMS68_003960 [Peltaster fructicola]